MSTSVCMFCISENDDQPEPDIGLGALAEEICTHCGASMFEALTPCASDGVSVASGSGLDVSSLKLAGSVASAASTFRLLIDPVLPDATVSEGA